MALVAQQIDAAQGQFRSFATCHNVNFLTDKFSTGIGNKKQQFGVSAKPNVDLPQVRVGGTLLLIDDPDNIGTFANIEIRDRRDQGLII